MMEETDGPKPEDPAQKQEVVTNCDYLKQLKFSPVLPLAFTEHGAIMAAGWLRLRQRSTGPRQATYQRGEIPEATTCHTVISPSLK